MAKKPSAKEVSFAERPVCVRVFGKSFFVNFIPQNSLSNTETFGHCDMTNQKINIHEGLTPIEEADTLLHEVIHAIDFTIGTGLTEHQVHHLASGLIGVLQDNEDLCKYLFEDKNVRGVLESNHESNKQSNVGASRKSCQDIERGDPEDSD